jgi:hypothetical protein
MKRKIVFILVIFFGGILNAQNSVKSYLSKYSSEEKVEDFLSPFEVKIQDVRNFKKNRIELQQFETSLKGYVELFFPNGNPNRDFIAQLPPRKIIIDIEFFNITEGSSNEAIIKAIASVKLDGGGYSNLKTNFNISAEKFTSLNLKKIHKTKYKDEVEFLAIEFSKRFAKKITDRILKETKNEEHQVYKITSIGTALKSESLAKAKESAKLMALVRASEIAFGMKITNTSEIVDFGDVTDIVLAETGGTVLSYEILEESVKNTADGYCCLIVKSIIKK